MSHFYTLYYIDEAGVLQEKEFAARNGSQAIDHVYIQREHGKEVMANIKLLDTFSNELAPAGGWA